MLGGVTSTAAMLFDKMPETEAVNLSGVGVDFFLQLKMGKVSYKLQVNECLFFLFNSAHRVFDRGKGFQLIGWILIWISTIVFATSLNTREKDGVLRIHVKRSIGNIRFLVLNTGDTVYHRVCQVQLRASPYHVLLSLESWMLVAFVLIDCLWKLILQQSSMVNR